MSSVWQAAAHEPIERLEDNLWTVASAPGSRLRRRMTLWKLSDGRVVVHSAIALSEPAQRELEAWGEPAFIVVPSKYHRIDAPRYKARYPNAKVLAPEEARAHVSKVVPVDGSFADLPADATASSRKIPGTRVGEHVFLVKSGARTSAIVNDLVFNHPHVPGFAGTVMRWIGSTDGPRITNIARWLMIDDAAAVRAELLAWAELPGLARVVVSHVDVIADDPAGTLRRLAATL